MVVLKSIERVKYRVPRRRAWAKIISKTKISAEEYCKMKGMNKTECKF